MKKLLVIARHRPTVLLAKGEYTPRYYNPGNVFDEVHLLLTNSDKPPLRELQFTAGKAKLVVHNLPRPDFRMTLGWRPWLIRKWIGEGIEMVHSINPNLIRVHNNFLEGYLGQKLKGALDIPYLVSIHHAEWQFKDTLQEKILGLLLARYEKGSLQHADGVIAVYRSNFEYAQKLSGADPRLIYNVVSDQIPRKRKYSGSNPPKLITINQQISSKNPENILRAIAEIDCEYWLVGNGPIHQDLVELVNKLGIQKKVKISTGISNEKLTGMLKKFDLHISHCDIWGMSKTVIEASLAGLPTLINFNPLLPIPEYDDEWIIRCENSVKGYGKKIKELLADQGSRESVGNNAHAHAEQFFSPIKMEMKLAALYTEKMV